MKIFFAFIIILALIGCSAPQIDDSIKSDEIAGTSLGLAYFNSENNQLVHKIAFNEKYTPLITIINHLPRKQRYRLFFILDYNQVSVLKDNKKISYIDVVLDKEEEKHFEITLLAEPNKGVHDFTVVSIRSPEYFKNEKDFIVEDRYFMYRRAALIVGDSEQEPNIKYSDLQSQSTKLQYVQPILTEGGSLRDFKDASILINSTKDLNVNINFSEKTKFAIMALSTKGQIPIENKFFSVSSPGQVTFPLNITGHELAKPYNLYIMIFNDPFGQSKTIESRVHASNLITVQN